ncbi:hypothetical protein GOODEAATRI_020810 [Goodea atripinnis]|uniref:FERM domain-containing protein n=1 Tax=Goodea atripinnis TaxID=208336 RepID=A0ABV0N333_9TELE
MAVATGEYEASMAQIQAINMDAFSHITHKQCSSLWCMLVSGALCFPSSGQKGIWADKNYFVTRIRLLDNNVIECTLSVESTGQECLEAVAQRLELREVSGLLSDTA